MDLADSKLLVRDTSSLEGWPDVQELIDQLSLPTLMVLLIGFVWLTWKLPRQSPESDEPPPEGEERPERSAHER
jgi:hypothetical protein